jgi:hypothetical protein
MRHRHNHTIHFHIQAIQSFYPKSPYLLLAEQWIITNLSFSEAISVNGFLKGLKKALPKKYFFCEAKNGVSLFSKGFCLQKSLRQAYVAQACDTYGFCLSPAVPQTNYRILVFV